MKILLLSNKVPYPANDGSSIAIASMVDALLKSDVEVSLLSLNTLKHFKSDEEIARELPPDLDFHQVPADTNISFWGALSNLIGGSPYHVSRFKQKAFSKKLSLLLSIHEYDVVQLEGLAMAVYYEQIKSECGAKVVLRAHNVESRIWERHIQNERNIFKRWYLRLQVDRLVDFEVLAVYNVDAVVAITDEDLKAFRLMIQSKKGISIPCGINIKGYEPCAKAHPRVDVAYLASFDWLPNRQGAWWFIQEVWPLLREKDSEITFKLGGRHMPSNMKALEVPGIETFHEVLDMREFICNSELVVVPLLAGSGMRIKILENMALGVCQVTTSIGAEGIAVEPGKNIVLADTPREMADAILALLKDPEQIRQIGKAARQTVQGRYDNAKLGAVLLDFYETEVC